MLIFWPVSPLTKVARKGQGLANADITRSTWLTPKLLILVTVVAP